MRRGRRLGQVVPVAVDSGALGPNDAAASSAALGPKVAGPADLDQASGAATGAGSDDGPSYVGRHVAGPRHAAEPGLLTEVARAALTGARATVPMTAVLVAGQLVTRYGELPPRMVTRRGLERLGLQVSTPTQLALTAVNHVTFGAILGAVYGVLRREVGFGDSAAPAAGAAYAAGAYVTSYGGWLPLLRLSPALWRDNRGRQVTLLLAHLAFGARLGSGLRRPSH